MLTLTTLTRVSRVVDTVNMIGASSESVGSTRGYHHGNLRAALVAVGVTLARTGGPGAVVLRAASRGAGASHNAAYRHFANQEDLVAAVAQQCMNELSRLMIERADHVTARGPIRRAQARLEAIGRAYLEFARTEPGWFRTAFSSARAHPLAGAATEPGQAPSPYLVLSAQLDELVAVGALTVQRRRGAEIAVWSAVHGLACLLLDGPLRDLPEADVERAVRTVLGAIGRSLR